MSTLKEICKEQTEMIDEMSQNIKELTEENEKLSEQYNKMLEERNSLIDDLSWYKAKVSRLERENGQLKQQLKGTREFFVDVTKRNEELMVKSKQYTTLTDHIRMKAENNPGVSRYIDLVNYIDRLEKD